MGELKMKQEAEEKQKQLELKMKQEAQEKRKQLELKMKQEAEEKQKQLEQQKKRQLEQKIQQQQHLQSQSLPQFQQSRQQQKTNPMTTITIITGTNNPPARITSVDHESHPIFNKYHQISSNIKQKLLELRKKQEAKEKQKQL